MKGKKAPASDRFVEQVYFCPITGCWYWMGRLDRCGYGSLRDGVKMKKAHRYSWESVNGPVPDGLVLDHFKCNNPSCVNPDHLRPVTQRENVLRGNTNQAANLAKRVCPKCGGDYTTISRGSRVCKPCASSYAREWAKSKKETPCESL